MTDKDNFRKVNSSTAEDALGSNITKSDVVLGANDESDEQIDFGGVAINSELDLSPVPMSKDKSIRTRAMKGLEDHGFEVKNSFKKHSKIAISGKAN